MKKSVKVLLIVLASVTVAAIVAVVVFPWLLWGALDLVRYPLYREYYDMKTDVCENPGLSDGFVCQGICVEDESGKILVSGYMKDHSAGRIYVTDKNDNSYYVSVKEADGTDFTGHAGGIATRGGVIYIASDDLLRLISLTDVMNAENGDEVYVQAAIGVNNEASFVYADEDYIYVGEFHDGEDYVTNHPYEDPNEGMHYAIVSRYLPSEFVFRDDGENVATPDRVYSIRNKVQGICFAEGKVVMSTSYGLADSIYYVYDEANATDSGHTLDGAPVYFLGECQRSFKGPAMAEGLEYYDGEVITLTESASDKYIFGKFFLATKIVSLDIFE